MNGRQVKRAAALRRKGRTVRAISAELGVPPATVGGRSGRRPRTQNEPCEFVRLAISEVRREP
jgi:hypothetical protein